MQDSTQNAAEYSPASRPLPRNKTAATNPVVEIIKMKKNAEPRKGEFDRQYELLKSFTNNNSNNNTSDDTDMFYLGMARTA